jgi:hypothetical protein
MEGIIFEITMGRFAKRPDFAPETPPARERLPLARTIKMAVAPVATVGAAGVEVAQDK